MLNNYLEIEVDLQKKEELNTYIKEQIKNKYSFECKSLYDYYNYYVSKKEMPPLIKSSFIKENKDTTPSFIKRFIGTIYDEYRDDINENDFNMKLNKRISREIDELFL